MREELQGTGKYRINIIEILLRYSLEVQFDCIENEAIREDLLVFNLSEELKDYKQRWKERLETMSDYRLAEQVWK